MSPRAVRFSAIPLALFGLACSVADDVRSTDSNWWILPMVVTLGGYCLLVWRAWHCRRLRLDPRHRRYAADAHPVAGLLIISYSSVLVLVFQPRMLAPTSMARLHEIPGALGHSLPIWVAAFIVGCAYALSNRPMVWLDARGISVVHSRRAKEFVAWADIAPYGAVIDRPPLGNRLRVFLHGDAVAGRGSRPVNVPLGRLNIDGRVLASAINYYVAHPESVPEIGTAADFAQLAGRTEPPPAEPNPMGVPA